MKRKYTKPLATVIEIDSVNICEASPLRWHVDHTEHETEIEETVDFGQVKIDKNDGSLTGKEDPWNSENW